MSTASDDRGRRGPRGRGRRLIAPLRAVTALAFVMAGAALVLGPDGSALATALAMLLVGAPLARVAFLAVRWAQLGDRRFSWLAALLLIEIGVAAGATLAT